MIFRILLFEIYGDLMGPRDIQRIVSFRKRKKETKPRIRVEL